MNLTQPSAGGIETTTLGNGIRVVTETMPAVRSIAVGVWVGTGARSEQPAESGISHFIEHMLFKGTPARSAEDIARQVDSIGGHLDAFTGKELVGFNTKVLDEHLPIAFEILSDMLLNPMLAEEDVAKEKGVILEELKMDHDSPEYLVHEIFISNFWKRHALGRPILGTKKTINSFNSTGLRAYHNLFYRPGNLTVTAAGSLRHAELVALVDGVLGRLAPGGALPAHDAPTPTAFIELRNKRSLKQVHLTLGVPCYAAGHPLRFACYALNVILGGGMSSRLFQNVRERQGLAYAIYSELNLYTDCGCLLVSAGTSQEWLPRVIGCIMDEIKRVKDEPLSAEELRRVKDHMKGSLMLSLESTSSRMGNLARQVLYFGRTFSLDEILENIEAVTAAQVQSVAREIFLAESLSLAVLGNLNGYAIDRAALRC